MLGTCVSRNVRGLPSKGRNQLRSFEQILSCILNLYLGFGLGLQIQDTRELKTLIPLANQEVSVRRTWNLDPQCLLLLSLLVSLRLKARFVVLDMRIATDRTRTGMMCTCLFLTLSKMSMTTATTIHLCITGRTGQPHCATHATHALCHAGHHWGRQAALKARLVHGGCTRLLATACI